MTIKHGLVAGLVLAAEVIASEPSTTTTDFFFPMGNVLVKDFYASVITAGPTATEYLVQCVPDEDFDECYSFANSPTLTLGPSTVSIYQEWSSPEVGDIDCAMFGNPRAAECSISMSDQNWAGTLSMTFPPDEYPHYSARMTITAGLEKLVRATAAAPVSTSAGSTTAKDVKTTETAAWMTPIAVSNTASSSRATEMLLGAMAGFVAVLVAW